MHLEIHIQTSARLWAMPHQNAHKTLKIRQLELWQKTNILALPLDERALKRDAHILCKFFGMLVNIYCPSAVWWAWAWQGQRTARVLAHTRANIYKPEKRKSEAPNPKTQPSKRFLIKMLLTTKWQHLSSFGAIVMQIHKGAVGLARGVRININININNNYWYADKILIWFAWMGKSQMFFFPTLLIDLFW